MIQTELASWDDPETRPLIEFVNVTKRFGDFTAIDNQSLKIYKGEFFALLGPSGCGKTTMMRMLAGFEMPTEGTIRIDGLDVSTVPPNKRAVNMMFQSYALFPHLSVWDNIAFGLRREGKSGQALTARVEEMLRLTRMEKFARRKPHQISGGQRQRVALARSLAKAPKLLLLDEPLGALDKKLRQETQFELMDIQESTGTTFVIVTHDQEEAMTVASRVAVMDEGKLVQVATPDVIYEAPNSIYVADFIGDVSLISGVAKSRVPSDVAPQDSAGGQPSAQQQDTPRQPQPNAFGAWLHDTVFEPVLGARSKSDEQAVEPAQQEDTVTDTVRELPAGGIAIHWADGQDPIIATNADPCLDGKTVNFSIRPEKIGISKARPDALNAFQGKVIDIAYLGHVSTYHVVLTNGLKIMAQVSNTRRISRRSITWEDDVWISFSSTAGVALEH